MRKLLPRTHFNKYEQSINPVYAPGILISYLVSSNSEIIIGAPNVL